MPLQPQRVLVFRGQLLDGFGLATAGQGFRSQRFRPAARRFTEIPAQKTEHRLWNIEMLWLRSEFVGTDARANQRQRKVTDHLGRRRDLDQPAQHPIGTGVGLFDLLEPVPQTQRKRLLTKIGQLTTWDLMVVHPPGRSRQP